MSNHTTSAEIQVNFYYIFTIILLCVFILVAFFGNLIVLIVFCTTKELQTQVNYFLASLAFADFLTACFPLPLWLAVKVHNHRWPFSSDLLKVWQYADLTFCTASVWNLCAISIDRCLAISWPFLHRSVLTPFRIKCAVAVVWGCSGTISLLVVDKIVVWQERGVLIACLSYYIPTVLIVATYVTIYVAQLKSRFLFTRQENYDISLGNRAKQDLKMAKYMMLLIASFLICWAPHFILSTLFPFTKPKLNRFHKDTFKAMSYLNSCVNPFLYGYVSPKFRVAFKGILRHRARRTSRHAWGEMSPARGTLSKKTSVTRIEEKSASGSNESAV